MTCPRVRLFLTNNDLLTGARYTASMTHSILPGPTGPAPDGEPAPPTRPSLGSFLHSRVMGPNGVVAALYLVLSAWVWFNPARAARVWRRLQGEK